MNANKQNSKPNRLRLLLVMPDANIHRLAVGGLRISFREAPLTLTTLAALVPAELDAEITLVDESVDEVPWAREFDLVGISCLTGTAPRAYEIADQFRSRGSAVVLGGIHVALCPEEAAGHADSIVVGFAEQAWPQLLCDHVAGRLQREYRQEGTDLTGLPEPRRDLQKRFGYTMPQTVFATRGCHQRCAFCTVPAVPFGWHTRPVGDVVAEVARLRGRRFAFNDVNLVSDREHALELFNALIPLKKKWGGLAPVSLASDPELLEVVAKSGCQYLLVGFESIRQAALGEIHKNRNLVSDYRQAVETFHRHGIVIQGCFIFGMDDDTPGVFAETVNAINELGIDIPRFAVYTPYPGTSAFARLKKENRILHQDWQYYDTQHVVFQPAQMTAEELYSGFRWAYRRTFSRSAVLRRTFASPHPVITLLGNTAYRLYARRLSKASEHQRRPSAQEPGPEDYADRLPARGSPPGDGGKVNAPVGVPRLRGSRGDVFSIEERSGQPAREREDTAPCPAHREAPEIGGVYSVSSRQPVDTDLADAEASDGLPPEGGTLTSAGLAVCRT